jgi:drug/metabolite transporter (DMT)-like permease
MLLCTFFFWGSVYVGSKLIPEVPTGLVGCLRCCIAAIPLQFVAQTKFKDVKLQRGDIKYLVSVGALGYFATIYLIQKGIALTGASTASLINSMTPVAVTVLAAIVLKEKITPVKVLCLILALAGTYIITTGATGEGEMLGAVLVLLSVVSWAVASVNMRQLTSKYPPVLVTAYGMTISLLFHIPVGIYESVQAGTTGLSAKAILVLLYLGLVGSALPQYTWTASLSMLPASTCSLFYPLQPTFSAILGALLLGETFKPTFFVGMLLISIDVVLSTLETRRLSFQKQEKSSGK